ncbi:MarR family winged helix-turn-helix transcriptional regulator [Pseudonocardia sp. NPDC049635]|uniref:MarR family winged helix-turn-helix transcriptional regulator n=1 Tax=Pseudonocardia sp. NPDC049635 TaxID=3155506 RepID=UPI0033D10802
MLDAVGHLIRRAQQLHVLHWQEAVTGSLTSTQFGVLLVLAQWPGVQQRAVAELISLDKTTTADVLRRLTARGLVVRESDPSDGRGRLARLTDAGRAAVLAAAPSVVDVQRRLIGTLPADDGEVLTALLRRIAYEGRPPDPDADTPANATVAGWPARLPPLRLHTAPGHLVRRAQQRHTTLWADLVSTQLTSAQYSVLLVLHDESPADQREVGRRASLDKSTGSEVVARLVAKGLVVRGRDREDGRRNVLTLSDSGRRTLIDHAASVFEVQRRLLARLTEQDADRFVALMARMVDVDQDTRRQARFGGSQPSATRRRDEVNCR